MIYHTTKYNDSIVFRRIHWTSFNQLERRGKSVEPFFL